MAWLAGRVCYGFEWPGSAGVAKLGLFGFGWAGKVSLGVARSGVMEKSRYVLEIYESPMRVQWNWRLKAANGKITASGTGYNTKWGLMVAIDALEKAFAGPPIPIKEVKE
jgi:uncharacterized protein YegP (UPF0339 family)